MSVIIRENRKEDNEILAKIIRTSFHDFEVSCTNGTVYSDPTTDDLYSLFQTEKSALFVAEENGLILGCCGIFPTTNLPDDTTELAKFYLSKDARGKGIGKLLLEKCIEKAKGLGYKKVYLESIPEFSKAVSIYEKQGFRYLAKPLGDSGHSGCNLWMIKNLD
ncbi:GNAT family N-acetyltransferase [Epilithonimonas hispanica]|uniref:GNAT family N-acetyltransferase n=1 Tax=Epilithonimonas hispanica TaxID=358687 RepID=A0A3D9D474_9FLAO|nr:GNAT family N-acetyltransferase [Epilithonimonas hispanica]REC72813.1 GNAT family N-acetyltransferase [Epilithonimonas hispanica]